MVTLPRVRRPPLADAVLAGFLALVVCIEALTYPAVQLPALHAVVGTTVMVAIAWRRTFPLAIAALVLAANIVLGANGGELSVVFGLLIMAFTLGAETEGRTSWLGLLGLFGFFMAALVIGNQGLVPGDIGAGVVLLALPWVAGRTLREHATSLATAMSRADRLEEEKLHEAEAATTGSEPASPVSCTTSCPTRSASSRSSRRPYAADSARTRRGRRPTSPASRRLPGTPWPRCADSSASCTSRARPRRWLRNRGSRSWGA